MLKTFIESQIFPLILPALKKNKSPISLLVVTLRFPPQCQGDFIVCYFFIQCFHILRHFDHPN